MKQNNKKGTQTDTDTTNQGVIAPDHLSKCEMKFSVSWQQTKEKKTQKESPGKKAKKQQKSSTRKHTKTVD